MLILESAKWIADVFFLVATGIMYNQRVAAKSLAPWILFLVGNAIWLVDSVINYNLPWIVLAVLFILFDSGLLLQRIRNPNVTTQ